ncbi:MULTISPECIES: hypothetical protein [Rhizobium/Agrobacterium group]|uniref:hypothetical protein n=1 Tax=Rhizobium/Agrobacterium group TaxID=227290 RepID=UPI00138F9DD2|nr:MULTISPECIES: hypothetical protein [Rhizobium/Agrobacterium group]NSZ42542.1 hypothetical protein [Agrobacterium vitis]NTA26250.1 hypothetical protein [Allorhizobium ampelinum]
MAAEVFIAWQAKNANPLFRVANHPDAVTNIARRHIFLDKAGIADFHDILPFFKVKRGWFGIALNAAGKSYLNRAVLDKQAVYHEACASGGLQGSGHGMLAGTLFSGVHPLSLISFPHFISPASVAVRF